MEAVECRRRRFSKLQVPLLATEARAGERGPAFHTRYVSKVGNRKIKLEASERTLKRAPAVPRTLFFPTDGGAHTSGREHPSRVPRTLFSTLVWLELVNQTWLSSSRVAGRLRAAPWWFFLFFSFARTATCFVWPKGAKERTFPVSGTRAQSGRRGARPFWWIWCFSGELPLAFAGKPLASPAARLRTLGDLRKVRRNLLG